MFKEGICPGCHEKIQVPDDREKILCMFCGKEISVDEALGRTTEKIPLAPAEYDEYLQQIKSGLEKAVKECGDPMGSFNRDKYAGVFEKHCEEYKSIFDAMEAVYAGGDRPEEAIGLFVQYLTDTVRAELEKIKFRSKRNQQQMDYNFLISVYMIPAAMKYQGTFTGPFADRLIETWNREFQTNIGKACYEDIVKGFRRKLCYITTAVCESLGKGPDCYELSVLKKYRDEQLETTPEGKALVEEYYNIAPTIVKRMEKEPDKKALYQKLYENYLMPCIREIENQEYEACQSRYQDMVLELKERYLS